MGSSGLELGFQGFKNSLSLCCHGLCSSWPGHHSAALALSLFISQPSFPLLVSLLLSSCRYGFIIWLFTWRRWPPNALGTFLHLGLCGVLGGSASVPQYPHVDFREGLCPCLVHIPTSWTVPVSGQEAVNDRQPHLSGEERAWVSQSKGGLLLEEG